MSRQEIRQLKRVLKHGRHPGANWSARVLAQQASLQLLERSIKFGHGRLAIVRLAMAVRSGAPISHEHWNYCHQYAASSQDPGTLNLFNETAQANSGSSEFSIPKATAPQLAAISIYP